MLFSIFNELGRTDLSLIFVPDKNFGLFIIHFKFVC